MGKLREECGVFGIYSTKTEDLASAVYYGLFSLQHRGQESCGMVINDDGVFNSYKDIGLVSEVFTHERLHTLGQGNIAIGHVRYGTTGSGGVRNAQPIVVDHIKGHMALAHNGNLVNSAELRNQLELSGSIFHTTSDTEVIAYIITKERINSPSIEEAVACAMNRIDGAYSLVLMSPSKLVAVRDPHGFRPLCYGMRQDGSYVVSSESCALDSVGASFIRDLEPGEILVFDGGGVRSDKRHCGKFKESLCVFEFIYFARPDSVINGCSVHSARLRAGELLARRHPAEADVVIGVPDSAIDAAVGYSRASGIAYDVGLSKNRYIGRTFIVPGQSYREDKVRIKFNPVSSAVCGKRIVLVDDTIVRGTTSAHIVKLLRDAGAKEIHMRIAAPPFRHPCYYGTDIDSAENLIANHYTIEQIRGILGVDSLGYLEQEDAEALCNNESDCESNPPKKQGFCSACFSGCYPTLVPSNAGKKRFEYRISENKDI
jgi:amidophosphoribosyltransferase